MKLKLFNGGLHTEPSPHLIQPSEGRVYANIDYTKRTLTPVKDKTVAVEDAQRWAFYYSAANQWKFSPFVTEWVEYASNLYFTRADGPPRKIVNGVEYNLSLTNPVSADFATSGVRLFRTDQVSTFSATVTEHPDQSGTSDGIPPGIVELEYKIYSSSDTAFSPAAIAIAQEQLIVPIPVGLQDKYTQVTFISAYPQDSNSFFRCFRQQGGIWRQAVVMSNYNLGNYSGVDNFYQIGFNPIEPASTGRLEGTYTYGVTFYSNVDGAESALIVSNETTVSGVINIVQIPRSADSQVTSVRLWRIGGDSTQWTLVTTFTPTTTPNMFTSYQDRQYDFMLPGDILTVSETGSAPADLRFLIESNAMLFGASGNQLRFTPIGRPSVWPALFFIQFANTITGLGKTSAGVLVFTETTTHLITGSGPRTLASLPIDFEQGCIANGTVKSMQGSCLWVSRDGVCTSSGSNVSVITRNKLGKLDLDPINAAVWNGKYYVQKSDANVFVVDFSSGIFADLNTSTSSVCSFQGKLFSFASNTLYEMFSSEDNTVMSYRSPTFVGEDYSQHKIYKSLYYYAKPPLTIRVFIDDVFVVEEQILVEGGERFLIPSEVTRGNSIYFEVEGSGELYELIAEETPSDA